MYRVHIKTPLKNEPHFPEIAEALEDHFDNTESQQKTLGNTWNLYFTVGAHDGETAVDEGEDIQAELTELADRLDIRIEARFNGKGADDMVALRTFHGFGAEAMALKERLEDMDFRLITMKSSVSAIAADALDLARKLIQADAQALGSVEDWLHEKERML